MPEDKSQERESKFYNKENQKAEKRGSNGGIHEEIYDSSKYISTVKRVQNGTVPMNILEFHYSFSYDCQRYFNLCVAEPNVVVFASGNILHFLNTVTNKLWFRRGYTGGGIGYVTKNPAFNHIAIAENGIEPPIIIYKWPSMDIVTVLNGGTLKRYCHLAYSIDGLLLVSQGGDPDYTITLWDWQKSKIALKCKSYNRDIYNITISPSLPGYLVTSGSGHIKFWKISETFTGLKLKGEIGRFGQTEISDIIGVYIMPDGKVVSGCEWGNILLWEQGLITLEICRKNRQPCHTKAITQFEYINGELISVGMDGWIRVWFYETIDQADSHNGQRFLEVQPIYEYHISEDDKGNSSMLMCIRKQELHNPENTFWYAQDGNGGIWLIDLHTLKAELPRKIFTCHAGAIADMDSATWGPFVATLGKAGQLHIYNYIERRLILVHKFNDVGSQVVWFPCLIEATGSTLACAFGSGVIRIIAVAVSMANAANDIKGDYIRLIQVVKPHKMAITTMSLNPSYSLLVTGSEDSTVFSFAITMNKTHFVVTPIGFIKVPSEITYLTWKPQHETTLLIGCSQGDCVEVTLPNIPQSYTIASYELVQCRPKAFKFHSVKSAIRRELIRLNREKEKKEKIAKRREEMERLMAESSGMEINEEAFLIDTEEEEPLPEIYIPKIPNKVLMAEYITHDVIWLSMAGFDAGYIYEYPSPQITEDIGAEPVKSTIICDADDIEIRSCLFYKKRYLFLGMEDGQIRVCKWKSKNYADLSDYWILSMHDNYNGYIPKMILSYDQKMLFTCGYDGNLFSYKINDDTPSEIIEFETIEGILSLPYTNVEDIEKIDHASLEDTIQQAEHDRIAIAAMQTKHRTLEMLFKLSEEYSKIVERNNTLPKYHQITYEELELDPRITVDLNKELEAELTTIREKLTFRLKRSELGLQKLLEHFIQPITCLPFVVCKISKPNNVVYSLRQHILDTDIVLPSIDAMKHVHAFDKRMNGNSSITDGKKQRYEEKQQEEKKGETIEKFEVAKTEEQPIADFLKDINYKNIESSLGIQLNQMLRKYNLRKTRLKQREKEWQVIFNEKPDIINHIHDVSAIEEAKRTIGDYKLKTSSTFNLLSKDRDTLFSKYKEILNCRKKLYYLQEAYNVRLKAARTEKEHLHAEVLGLIKSLKKIHAEIPLESIKSLPTIPTLNINVEFPERKIMIEKYTSKDKTQLQESILPEQTFVCPDEEYEVLLLEEKFPEHAKLFSEPLHSVPEKKLKIQSAAQDNIALLHLSDDIDSPWEREMKSSRVLRKIYEQDCILRYIQDSCENLDKKLDKLEHDRLDIVAENVYINLFLLTLRQEYIILREYETTENVLHDQVNHKLKEIAAIKQKIQMTTDKADAKTKEITKLHNQIKDISSEYMSRISDNKFRNFLCRILRKKYKEFKEEDETTTTTTETSSDERNSIDNGETAELVYLDENICPPGCDKKLYELAFTMREKRYACEHQIKDAHRIMEILHKEIQIQTKKLKIIESDLKKNEDDLKIFMLEKQRRLNDVDVTVIIKLHQLQYFEESGIPSKVHDCVIFDKKKLSGLYARIQELHEETLELHAKHKRARMHLRRIKLDCKHMRVNNKNLKSEIKLKIMNKFGQDISLNKLYETVLHRMVYDIKANLNETTMYFIKRIKHVKESYAEELIIFNKLIREHTQKLNFLTILVEEQSKLQKLLKQNIMSDEEMLQLEEKYKSDIAKLERILENQTRQKYLFRNDIKNLRLKTKSQHSIHCKEIMQKNDRDIESQSEKNFDQDWQNDEIKHITNKKKLEFTVNTVDSSERFEHTT